MTAATDSTTDRELLRKLVIQFRLWAIEAKAQAGRIEDHLALRTLPVLSALENTEGEEEREACDPAGRVRPTRKEMRSWRPPLAPTSRVNYNLEQEVRQLRKAASASNLCAYRCPACKNEFEFEAETDARLWCCCGVRMEPVPVPVGSAEVGVDPGAPEGDRSVPSGGAEGR